jgi:hypothetical protein
MLTNTVMVGHTTALARVLVGIEISIQPSTPPMPPLTQEGPVVIIFGGRPWPEPVQYAPYHDGPLYSEAWRNNSALQSWPSPHRCFLLLATKILATTLQHRGQAELFLFLRKPAKGRA